MANQETYIKETLHTWNAISSHWDDGIGGDGNKYWKLLQRPSLERLIEGNPGFKALDLATGNGLTARWLASRGASVIATDGCESMLEKAIARTADDENRHKITFRKLDVTCAEEYDALLKSIPWASEGFDVVLINMAIMDIPTIEPLVKALPKLLKKDGVFVATQLHPVFFTSGARRIVEVNDEFNTGEPHIIRAKILKQYMSVAPWRGIALPGQPELQWYFHRSLHELFGTFFKEGLVMDRMEELAFDEDGGVSNRQEAHSNFTQFPIILAFRIRRMI